MAPNVTTPRHQRMENRSTLRSTATRNGGAGARNAAARPKPDRGAAATSGRGDTNMAALKRE